MFTIVVVGGAVGIGVGVARRLPTAVAVARVRVAWKKTQLPPIFVSSVRSSNSHPDLLLIHPTTHPLFQITPVLNTGLSLSEPLQLYKGYNAI